MFLCIAQHMAEQAFVCRPAYRYVKRGKEPSFMPLLEVRVIYETAAGPHLQDP